MPTIVTPIPAKFRFTPAEETVFDREFSLVRGSINLESITHDLLTTIPAETGCYFWIMSLHGARFKIHLGKATSLRKRLRDYSCGFQIHSPNDFKLRFFQEFMTEAFREAELRDTENELDEFKLEIKLSTSVIRGILQSKTLRAMLPPDIMADLERFAEVYI